MSTFLNDRLTGNFTEKLDCDDLYDLSYSDYKLKVVHQKAFLISQVLDATKVEPSSSGLGLEGFRQLINETKKKRDPNNSGKHNSRVMRMGGRDWFKIS
jgi:hypothetical protein